MIWGADPRGYDAGLYTPHFGIGGASWRWPYSSSYWVTISVFDGNNVFSRCWPATYGSLYVPGNAKFGGRRISDVSYPSQKVYIYEQFGRHSGPFTYADYFGFPTAKPVVQAFDNSCSIKNSSDANYGANPNSGASYGPNPSIPYNPGLNSPDPAPPGGSLPSFVYYQYTKGGLKGVDFGGKENNNWRQY